MISSVDVRAVSDRSAMSLMLAVLRFLRAVLHRILAQVPDDLVQQARIHVNGNIIGFDREAYLPGIAVAAEDEFINKIFQPCF